MFKNSQLGLATLATLICFTIGCAAPCDSTLLVAKTENSSDIHPSRQISFQFVGWLEAEHPKHNTDNYLNQPHWFVVDSSAYDSLDPLNAYKKASSEYESSPGKSVPIQSARWVVGILAGDVRVEDKIELIKTDKINYGPTYYVFYTSVEPSGEPAGARAYFKVPVEKSDINEYGWFVQILMLCRTQRWEGQPYSKNTSRVMPDFTIHLKPKPKPSP